MAIDWSLFAIPKSRDGKLRVEAKREKRLSDETQERDARRAVRDRDGSGCAVPGCKEKGRHLHHIVYRSRSRKLRWNPLNLCFLCPSHHQLEHGGKIHIARNADGELIVTGDRKHLEFRL